MEEYATQPGDPIDLARFDDAYEAAEVEDREFDTVPDGKYQVNDQWAVALRIEGFNNDNGTRGVQGLTDPDPGLFCVTATLEHKPVSALILRFEVRVDTADEEIFQDSDGLGEDSQATVGFEVIFIY